MKYGVWLHVVVLVNSIYLFIYIALLLLYFKFKKIAQYEDKLTSLTNATRTLFVLAAFFLISKVFYFHYI